MSLIAIDCRFAALNAGLGRYTRLLVAEMLKQQAQAAYVLIVRNKNEEWIPAGANVKEADIPHYSIAEQIALPRIIRSLKADLFFSPHFNVPFFCPIPFVVTVHDLILHRYPNNASFIKRVSYRLLIKSAIMRAQSIIAVSSFTAAEISDVYGKEIANKTMIIPEGVDSSYKPADPQKIAQLRQKFNLQNPYVLYVGNAKEHKNVRMLIDAFQKASLSNTELVLVTGGPEFSSLLPLPSHVRQLKGVTDDDLPALYSAADVFVTASLYEGYCLPAAEALACGCPVIAVNRAAAPEILKHRGMLVEPSIYALADAMQRPPARREPVVVGTWVNAASRTEQVLLDAVYDKKTP